MIEKTKILIVEDESIVSEEIKDTLEDLGYVVTAVVSSGKKVIEKVKECPPDLVLMDIILKEGMDGIEVAKWIHTKYNIPVVYLTAYADKKMLERAKTTEPFGYIVKPFEERELNTTIEIALYKYKMEMRLKESEAWLSTTLRSIGDAVIATDLMGCVQFMNPVAESMTGWTHKEALGRDLTDVCNIMSKEKGNAIGNIAKKAIKEGNVIALSNNNLKLIARNGKEFQISDNAAPIRDEKGILIVAVLVCIDITERKKMEDLILQSKKDWEDTFNTITDMITIHDMDFNIIRANRASEKFLGIPLLKDKIGKCYMYFHGTDCPPEECPANRCLKTGRPATAEIFEPYLKKFIEVRAIPRFDSNKQLTGVVHVVRDITKRKALEEELLKSQKLESVGILSGGIAHDFNNLLTAILGNIDLAKIHSKPEGKAYERLREAEKASLRAKELAKRLLTFSRGGEPIKKTASIGELIKDSVTFALSGSNVRCEFFIADDLWTVESDKGQMNQVIHNIVINAREAIPEGGTVKIIAKNLLIDIGKDLSIKEGRYIKIAIEDEGIGIPKENLSRIFDPYFTTKEMGEQKGTGLGLSISHSIIKKHDGYIKVESEVGIGTTFTIYLPASEKEVTIKKLEEEIPVAVKGKVLVMDDEKIIRDVTGKMLKSIGYEVEFAKDGDEITVSYKRAMKSGKPFNTVIMDLTIPGGMGGKEAIKKLLEIDTEVKAIVSSGYSNDPIMVDFKKHGFKGVVVKPYNVNELSNILHKVISCE